MRFYQQSHQFYCGVDLHARSMHVSIVDRKLERESNSNDSAALTVRALDKRRP